MKKSIKLIEEKEVGFIEGTEFLKEKEIEY